MNVAFCAHCGAADPGRFCGGCGQAQPESSGASADVASQGPATPEPGPDDGATRIVGGPRQGWQPLPTLSGASSGDPTVLGQAPHAGQPYGHASIGHASYPAYASTPIILAPPAPEPRRSPAPPVVATASLLVAALVGGWWVVTDRTEPAATAAVATATPASSPTSAPRPPSTAAATPQPQSEQSQATPVAPQQPLPVEPRTAAATPPAAETGPTDAQNAQAERDMERQREVDLTAFDTRDRFVAQLSSKQHGRKDPRQPTSRGTITWQSVDILAQHRELRSRWSRVLLIRASDRGVTGAYANDWITIYDPGNLSQKGAEAWCSANFSADNDCAARSVK